LSSSSINPAPPAGDDPMAVDVRHEVVAAP
jgi:hypothetical protein